MSIADHFIQTPDAAFVRDYDHGSARRQFKVSVVLIVAFAIATTALGILVRFDASAPTSAGMVTQSVPSYAGKL